MESTLTQSEKEALYEVIQRVFGPDPNLVSYRSGFTPETVAIVEEAIVDITECNDDMKGLVAQTVGSSTVFFKGTLRRILKSFSRALQDKNTHWNGAACRNFGYARYRTRIITSAI